MRRNPLPIAATFSKSPCFWSGDPDWQPMQLREGRGARVLGNDGVWRLDYVSGLGALLLGNPDPTQEGTPANHWADAVCQQTWRGAAFSLPHPLEAEVAERICDRLGPRVPGWHGLDLGLRFGKNGSDACEASIRLARAVTGRKWIASVGYHGFGSAFVSTTPPAWGITHPQYVRAVPFGDLVALAAITDRETAAVIVEQPPQIAPDGYWEVVRRLCDETGALFILDEIVTGNRYGLAGAAERFGIAPDIECLGKSWSNGLPLSFIIGPRDYFDWFGRSDPVFFSSTAFGDAVSLAGASAVLDVWDKTCVDHIWKIGQMLIDGFADIGIPTVGYPPVFLTQWETEEERAYFITRMRDMSILANRPWLPNLSHSEADVALTLDAARKIKTEMQTVDVATLMHDKLPAVLFRNR